MRKLSLLFLALVAGMQLSVGQLFFSENFNGCENPGWTNVPADSTFIWEFTDASSDLSNVGNLDGTCMVLFDDDALGSGAVGAGATITSPAFDASGATGAVLLEYDYNFRSLGASFMLVEVWDGLAWDTVQYLTGISDCGAWSCGPPYPQASIDVTAQANAAMQVRYTYGDGGSFAWWAAFDNVVVRGLLSNDVGATAVIAPEDACGLSLEPITIEVTNFGFDTVTDYAAIFVLGTLATSEFVTTSLAPGATETYTFTALGDFSALGANALLVYASALPFDGDPSNDVLNTTITNIIPVATLTENFDSWATCSTSSTCTITCPAEGGWTNASDDDGDWRTNAAGTPSSSTGPASDNTTGTGNYMYMEASASCGRHHLVSPCLDVSGLAIPGIELWYHMYGDDMGTLSVEESTDNGATWNVIGSISGQQQTSSADPWIKWQLPFSSANVNLVRIVATSAATTFNGDMAIDDISILDLPPVPDVGVTSVDAPSGAACDLGGNESVTVTVSNIGTVDASGIDVAYSVNGGPAVVESLPGTVLVAGTASYTFAATADLSADGVYTIDAWTVLAADGDNSNDTSSASVENQTEIVVVADTCETFDSWTFCSTSSVCSTVCPAENGWANLSDDDGDWRTDAGGTPSSPTGPSADNTTGTGNYMYIESTTSCGTHILESPCYDISGLTFPGLTFYYHMHGLNMGELQIQVSADGGATYDTLYSRSGPDQAASTDPWAKVTAPLTGLGSTTLKFRVVGITAGTVTGDMAIDDFCVGEISADGDAAGQAVTIDGLSGCDPGAAIPVTITIGNAGAVDITGFDVAYSLNGGAPVVENVGALNIAPLNSADYTFATTFDASADGTYNVQAWTALSGDSDPSNDTTAVDSIVNEVAFAGSLLPLIDDYESYTDGTTAFLEIMNVPGTTEIWEAEVGPTSSLATGPVDDASGVGGTYAYIESSGSDSGDVAVLVTPCIDLTGTTNPEFSYAYHMHGAAIGALRIDIDAGGTLTNLRTWNGPQQALDTDPWKRDTLDLSAYIGQVVRIQISGETSVDTADGTTFESDIAIDELRLADPQPSDVGVVSILSPGGTACELLDGTFVTARVQNFGSSDVVNVSMRFQVDGGPLTTEIWAANLIPGEIDTFTFAATASLAGLTEANVLVSATSAGDANPGNDTLSVDIASLPSVGLPVEETFNLYTDGTSVFDAWSNTGPDLNFQAEFGPTPSVTSGPTGPDDDASGGGLYAYIETSGADSGDVAILTSPCLDLSSATSPRLVFSYHMFGAGMGSLAVDVREADGSITREFEVVGQQDTSIDDPWNQQIIDLSAYVGSTIAVDFVATVGRDSVDGTSFDSDISIDEITVDDPVSDDAGVIAILSPGDFCGADATAETVSAIVRNFGLNTLTSIQMRYNVNGGPLTSEVWSTSLASGATDTFTWAATTDLSGVGATAEIIASATALGDLNPANDADTLTVNNQSIEDAFFESFDSLAEAVTVFDNFVNVGADINWETEAGTTTSSSTGPTVDASGSATGIYVYLETSTPVDSGDQGVLQIPCVNIPSGSGAALTYAYHMYGASISYLQVTVSSPGGLDTLRTWNGQQQDSTDAAWGRDTLDLSAYAGQPIDIFFTGETTVDTATGAVFYGDMALDEIGVSIEAAVCSAAVPPQNPRHVNEPTRVRLEWDPVPLSVACQVRGTRLTPAGPSPTQNIFGLEPAVTNVPNAAAGAGTEWEWSVRCACSTSPIIATAFSVTDTFNIPVLREGESYDFFEVFPNPASDQVNLFWKSEVSGQSVIELVDLLGRTVITESVAVVEGENSTTLNVSTLAEGLYFVRIDGKDANQITVQR